MTATITRGAATALAAAALVSLAGCSTPKSDVTGKVRYNGKTLTTGTVSLFAQDNTQYTGVIGQDGTYSVPGVPNGTVKIVVSSPNPDNSNRKAKSRGGDSDLAAAAPAGPAPASGWFEIPEKYGDLATSGLTGEVKGNPAVLDIDLK